MLYARPCRCLMSSTLLRGFSDTLSDTVSGLHDVHPPLQMLDEWRPRFQAARTTMRDRRRRIDNLDLLALPFPPGRHCWMLQSDYKPIQTFYKGS
jgi:hypothetical protein